MSELITKTFSIGQLRDKLEQGEFAIPEIQRKFVWKRGRICDLMDSIYRGYPIGVSLIWTAPYSKAIMIRPNSQSIIPSSQRGNKQDLIIDGQQRLSSIYGIMTGDEKEINFKDLYVVCKPGGRPEFRFFKKDRTGEKRYVRLYDILNFPLSRLKSKYHLAKYESDTVQKVVEAFRKYRFCLIYYSGSGLEEDVREIFVRINSKGMSISRADDLFARASQVDLRHLIAEAKRNLKNGFDQISPNALQQTLGPIYGSKSFGQRGLSKFRDSIKSARGRNTFFKDWRSLRKSYGLAADLLCGEIGLPHYSALPSETIFTMLSIFFYHNRKRASRRQSKEIKKWFWHTCCGNRYSGVAFNRNIPKDIVFFESLAKRANVRYVVDRRVDPNEFFKSSYSGVGGTIAAKGYFILLRNQKPLYLDNGSEILLDNASSNANRKDRHHIFPKSILARKNVNPVWINSILNICYLAANENQSILNKAPHVYLEVFRRKKHFGKAMRRNFVPVDRASAVWTKNLKVAFKNFLEARATLLIREIEKASGGKIFEKMNPIARV